MAGFLLRKKAATLKCLRYFISILEKCNLLLSVVDMKGFIFSLNKVGTQHDSYKFFPFALAFSSAS